MVPNGLRGALPNQYFVLVPQRVLVGIRLTEVQLLAHDVKSQEQIEEEHEDAAQAHILVANSVVCEPSAALRVWTFIDTFVLLCAWKVLTGRGTEAVES